MLKCMDALFSRTPTIKCVVCSSGPNSSTRAAAAGLTREVEKDAGSSMKSSRRQVSTSEGKTLKQPLQKHIILIVINLLSCGKIILHSFHIGPRRTTSAYLQRLGE